MISSVEKKYNPHNNQFENYKMITTDNEEWFVPLDPANTDYQAIQEWIQQGNQVVDNPPE